jgi:putative PIN family toxin of toxin-antitoxin system
MPFLRLGKKVDFTQKIVIDANVWVRYVAQGKHATLLSIIRKYEFLVFCNNYLLHEIFNACTTNDWYTENEARNVVNAIRKVVSGTTETAVFRLSKDPKDNYLFDLAVQNNCRFIVSDDRLLRETPLKPVPVKTTSWFIKHYPPPHLENV